MNHCEESLLERIVDCRSCIHDLLKAFFDHLWDFKWVIDGIAYPDRDSAKTTASVWVGQQVIRKDRVEIENDLTTEI